MEGIILPTEPPPQHPWATFADIGMTTTIGPPQLALLAAFVQNSGHILIPGASARA